MMKFTRFPGLLVVVAAFGVATAGYAQELKHQPVGGKRPVLAGHRFVANMLAREAFPRTIVQTQLGVGQALDVEFPDFVLSTGDTLQGFAGDLMVAILDVDYQYALKDWMAVWGSVGLVGRLGTDTGALLAEGATVLTSFELGWLLRLLERETYYLSGTVNVRSSGFTGVNLTDWVEGILGGEDTPLVRKIPSVRAGVGLRFALAFNDLFGLTAATEVGYGDRVSRRTNDQTTFKIAAVGDVDLLARTAVPIGFALGGQFSNTPRDGSDTVDRIVQGLLRIAYTGRDDFLLAIDLQTGRQTGSGVKAVTVGTVLASMRYYF